ncbi:hypothetical protein [Mesonia aquimarina]|uniref:hypothetical protein n=1 Tax=Mesonia aquimarina TaxID=1504967 RepID=UPI000EF5AF56|nr:hypothetical protein [Mesonia aquimarina]
MRIFIVILIFNSVLSLSAQQKIVVVNRETHEVVSFPKITYLKNDSIVLGDSSGVFQYKNSMRVEVSCIGYEPFKIERNLDKDTISLKKKVTTLEEVIITGKSEPKYEEYGFHNWRKKTFRISSVEQKFYPGVYIKNPLKESKALIKKVYLKIKSKKKGSYVRLHIYAFNTETQKIERELLQENIILSVKNSNKLKVINIEDYKVEFPKTGVIVAIELIKNTDSINIAFGKSKSENISQTYYVRPKYEKHKPIKIEMGEKGNLNYMFGVLVAY